MFLMHFDYIFDQSPWVGDPSFQGD